LRCDESPLATASFTNRSIMYASGNPRPQATKVSHVRFLEPTNRRRNNHGGRLDDNLSSSGSDRDDDEDSLDEEERLDRELSRQHGEAVEARAASGSNKRPAASSSASADAEDQEIDALYQKAKRAKSKRAPDLTVESLTGPEGLIRIQTDFFRPDHLPQITNTSTASIASSAQFALSVVEAYKSFCFHLMPQLAFEDSLLKIERFGSKRPVKKYLDEMRHNERNKHVSKVLGEDRAHRVLQELHDAMQEQQQYQADGEPDHGHAQAENEGAGGGEGVAAAAGNVQGTPSPRQAPPVRYDDEREEEQEATFTEVSEAVTDRVDALSSATGAPDASRTNPVQGARRNAPARLVLDDTDSENEMDDDDDGNEDNDKGVTASRMGVGTDDAPPPSGAAAANASQRRRRFVMRDDDDDDDSDEDVDSETESMVDKNGEDKIAARPEAESTAGSSAKERGPMGAPNDAATEAPAEPLRDVAPASSNSPLDDDSATVLLRDASDSESNKKESFSEAEDGPGSGSPAQPVFAMPSAQDSPLESFGSSSPTSSSSSPASPASPTKLSSTTHLAMLQRSIDSPSRIVHEHGNPPCDSDDETATIVPSTLTGPTQWGDDDEDDVEENDGTVDITM
jgi:Replication Fork Protection Component Swi3